MNILHGTWSCSLNQINKGMSQIFDTPYRRVLQVYVQKMFFHNGGIANKVDNQWESIFNDGGIANQVDNQSNVKV
jgi:hypothetical protein